MAKLIKILAASMGGGLVLGAGIRLGEAIAARNSGGQSSTAQKLAERLGALENRLAGMEMQGSDPSGLGTVAKASAVQPQPDVKVPQAEAWDEIGTRLKGELLGWLEESVGTRMAEVETRLQAESEQKQKQLLDALVENLQTRVIQRISSLEEEVAGQSAAMSELRECSLRTEQSMQKLLGGLDRLIVNSPAALGGTSARAQTPDPPPRARRWTIFG